MHSGKSPSGFDFIGDVHGCFKTLCVLLETLGYVKNAQGVYCYADLSAPRQAVFVGDIVDRGAGVREVLHCVHDMVEAGHAQMVLGNHELYAIAYHHERKDRPGEYIRARTKRNYSLLEKTLTVFEEAPDEWSYFQGWLLKQPVFLDHPQFRAVHACWDDVLIKEYQRRFSKNSIDADFLQATMDVHGFENSFVERLLRGIELKLPDDLVVKGSDGRERNYFRTKFWVNQPANYNDVVFSPYDLPAGVDDKLLSAAEKNALVTYEKDQKPLFIGHYWQTGKPKPISDNIACVDYSAVRGGQLVAYRFDGESTLSANKFVAVESQEDQ